MTDPFAGAPDGHRFTNKAGNSHVVLAGSKLHMNGPDWRQSPLEYTVAQLQEFGWVPLGEYERKLSPVPGGAWDELARDVARQKASTGASGKVDTITASALAHHANEALRGGFVDWRVIRARRDAAMTAADRAEYDAAYEEAGFLCEESLDELVDLDDLLIDEIERSQAEIDVLKETIVRLGIALARAYT